MKSRVWLCVLFGTACASAPPPESAQTESSPAPPTPLAAPSADPELDASVVETPDASAPVSAPDAEAIAQPAVEEAPDPPPKDKRYRARGPCVDPMAHATRQLSGASARGKQAEFTPEPYIGGSPDLDGDGAEDLLVIGGVANITTTYFVYVMRGKCGHFAGRLESIGRLDATGAYVRGLRALGGLAPCQPQCCETLKYSEYRYDGARFTLAKQEQRKVADCSGLP